MKQWLMYLYPRAWRQRYGDEFRAVLAQHTLTVADVIDIVRGALDAHWTHLRTAREPHMVTKRFVQHILPWLGVASVLFACVPVMVGLHYLADPWRGVPLPPTPPFAQHLRTYYDSIGTGRTTEYDTTQSVADLEAFYRAALTRAGWRYRCTVTVHDPPCGEGWHFSDTSRVLVFDQGTPGTATWRTFEVPIDTDAHSGRHTVRLGQHLPDRRPQPSSTRAASTLHPLVGDWQATDPQLHRDFLLRLDDQGHASVVLPWSTRAPALWGTYHLDTTTLHVTLAARPVPDVQQLEPCVPFPAFFAHVCDAFVVPLPTSPAYPAPDATSPTSPAPDATSTPPAASYPGPTPLVTPPPITLESRIDTSFAVVLDGDTLILTHASGSTQTFHKIYAK